MLVRSSVVLWHAIHGSHPSGRRCATLKIAPGDFLWRCTLGRHPTGRCCATLKIASDDFLSLDLTLMARPTLQLCGYHGGLFIQEVVYAGFSGSRIPG
ncbi:MAG: hypothetical protein CVV09_01160 [Gammaproteobacteria bacterium HGW-Gammaproteobacteria-13]|nr:MAG: hypothetical protein CVV09_01160 [Gammaproteobacteria bacterium HGW-Gammaproteobacteria-13]